MNTNLLTVAELSALSVQDENLLAKFAKLSRRSEEHSKGRAILLTLMAAVGLVAMLGAMSIFLGLFIFFFLMPKAYRDTELGRRPLMSIKCAPKTETTRIRFEKVVATCEELNGSTIYSMATSTLGRVRPGREIKLADGKTNGWFIGDENNALYFLPNGIMVKSADKHAMVPYDNLEVDMEVHETLHDLSNAALVTFSLPEGPFFRMIMNNTAMAGEFCKGANTWNGQSKNPPQQAIGTGLI